MSIAPGFAPLVPEDPSAEQLQKLRRQRIGERANALRRAGYYLAEDVRHVRQWLDDDTYPMIDIEMLLALAEWEYEALADAGPLPPIVE